MIKNADPRLVEAWQKIEDARDAYANELKAVQEGCEHLLVAHWKGDGSDPYRICLNCRFEEKGSHWSFNVNHWKAADHTPSLLGTSPERLIFEVGRSEIFKLRVPTYTIQNS
tara:strand:+ start:252 stop:587 length:336 start_codon:yes stop_codon:yes gene_type:complete